jgi:hypothetical protein
MEHNREMKLDPQAVPCNFGFWNQWWHGVSTHTIPHIAIVKRYCYRKCLRGCLKLVLRRPAEVYVRLSMLAMNLFPLRVKFQVGPISEKKNFILFEHCSQKFNGNVEELE